MKINPVRLQQHFEAMSEIGKIGETGTCRPTMTPLEKQAFDVAGAWMQEAGMTVRIDNFGNLIGRLQGSNPDLPVLMMGSHLDSQPYGGRFDGVAGVLCAIEAVTTLYKNGLTDLTDLTQTMFTLNRAEIDRDIINNNVWQSYLLKVAATGNFDLFTNEF